MRKWIVLTVILIVVVFHAPFLMHVAGDAQVHLAVAENFATGHPFQYNENGPAVVASTSPFWTIMLILFFFLSGHLTPILLKIVTVLLWGATSYLLYILAKDVYRLSNIALPCLIFIWLTSTTMIANALGGLENILCALQLLLMFLLSIRYLEYATWRMSVTLGLLSGWTLLTRLDGGFFGLIIVLLLFATKLLASDKENISFVNLLRQLFWITLFSLLVVVPWYSYQYLMTGKIIGDSSVASLLAGRRSSLELIKGILHFHPKALFTIATVFFPLFLGSSISIGNLVSRFCRSPKQLSENLIISYHNVVAMILLCSGLFFYSFVVGASHFGRYFLPIFPFFFLCGFSGVQSLYNKLCVKNHLQSTLFLTIIMLYLIFGSSFDYYRRVVLGRQFSFNLPATVIAPLRRSEHTDNYLRQLGVSPNDSIRIAVTEVQLRYSVDDRIAVLSLDGRSSAEILSYYDKRSGIPDFERYFEDEKPDFVELGQCCKEGGWISMFFPSHLRPNLMCEWENRINQMKLESFDWRGHRVVLIAPNKVRINW